MWTLSSLAGLGLEQHAGSAVGLWEQVCAAAEVPVTNLDTQYKPLLQWPAGIYKELFFT